MGNNWCAELELGFQARNGRTLLAHRRHRGPLAVQKPFYPEGGLCHVYLLHPPGGVVGGDRLDIQVGVSMQASALITTPGATKFYRTMGASALQQQTLSIADGSSLEWFPQESIFFPGADAIIHNRIQLGESGRFIGWEILCLGRPANGERFDRGRAELRLELYRSTQPLLAERLRIDSAINSAVNSTVQLNGASGLRGYPVVATLLVTPADETQLIRARQALPSEMDGLAGITLVGGVLVCRFLGYQAEQARRCFLPIWREVREDIIGHVACPPRIWAT